MIKAVIFDMDGTILDTITDITTASNNALEAMGLPHYFTRDEVKLCFGSGIHDDIAKIIALARGCQGQDLIDLCETIPAMPSPKKKSRNAAPSSPTSIQETTEKPAPTKASPSSSKN